MVVCVALTKQYTQMVYLIDTHTSQILGAKNLLYSYPFKIKDIEFLPFSKTEFLSCGVQHMTLWSLKGGMLNFRELPIQNIKNSVTQEELLREVSNTEGIRDENSNLSQLRITFLAIIILMDEFIVTAGDDGYVSVSQIPIFLLSNTNSKDIHLEGLRNR